MILMNDFKKEYRALKVEIDKALMKAFESGWYILGKEVEEFEKEFSKYIGSKYCIGVANGLEAVQISLMALGIGKGDEVITVSNTAVATALAISAIGAKPVFIEVDEYYLMDVFKIEEKITPRTKAIIPVHLFGQMVNMTQLKRVAKKYKLKIVEDACQAHGAMQKDKKAGGIGDLSAFSFYPTKNLGALGDGGAITTNSKALYKKCKMLRNYGQKNRYHHEIRGINSRLDEVQAAILQVKLKHLDSFVNRRNNIAKIYDKNLRNVKQIKLPKVMKGNYHSFHLYVIEVENRNNLLSFLLEKGIQTLIHYPIPVHKQKCYSEYNCLLLPKTESLSKCILSLPINPFITEREARFITDTIKSFYNGGQNEE